MIRKLNTVHLTQVLGVLHPRKRPDTKAAIESGQILIIDDETQEGKAFADMCKGYKVPFVLRRNSYEV